MDVTIRLEVLWVRREVFLLQTQQALLQKVQNLWVLRSRFPFQSARPQHHYPLPPSRLTILSSLKLIKVDAAKSNMENLSLLQKLSQRKERR